MLVQIGVVLILFVSACSKKGQDGAQPSADNTAATTADKPSAATAIKLTSELVLAAEGLVEPGQKFDEALARLEGKLGKPQFVLVTRDLTMYHWAHRAGDQCTLLAVQKGCDDGGVCADQVGVVESPRTETLTANKHAYKKCVAATEGKDYKASIDDL
ncbi:MAG: hypothetical protein H0V17_09075 [Deltaproteobacteria bacterium]|nr:hypothetical protein [Deltaproteobacteria bacterium]